MSLMRHGGGDVADWMRSWMDVPRSLMGPWLSSPDVVVREEPEKVVATVALPGMDPAGVEVTVRPLTLTIRGEESREERGGAARRFGSFSRTVSLPTPIAVDRAKARCHRGILEVTMPKEHPEDGGRRLEISEES